MSFTMQHLELEIKSIVEKTPRFVEELQKFVQNPAAGLPWLHISTLRIAALALRADYQRIDDLLAILEQQAEAQQGDPGAPVMDEPRVETISAQQFFEEVFIGIQRQQGKDEGSHEP